MKKTTEWTKAELNTLNGLAKTQFGLPYAALNMDDQDYLIDYAKAYDLFKEENLKANGNPVNEYTFKLISGDFYEGETVTVETVLDGKQYTRKVKNDAWDLYITIKNVKCYWECDRID